MTFYLKYRPQKLEELDIAEARESLKKTVSSGKIPHAFLFSGPKGTGKTSAARIIAKILNCEKKGKEPCNKCEQCVSITNGYNIDVIELDAASHRGIDDVRALKDAVKLAPASARKKVYIIDEAHMLTTEASNALLKTLEEPPAHVNFILATTNPEKLIETIRSRATLISFHKATAEEMIVSLTRIARGEKMKIDKEILAQVGKAAEGSFRDGAKLMEALSTEKVKLDRNSVEEFLFRKKTFDLDEFISLLIKRDTKGTITEIANITQKGGAMETLLTGLLGKFREELLSKIGIGEPTLPDLTKEEILTIIELFTNALSELKTTTIEELPVEIAVIRWCEGKKLEMGSEKVEKEVRSGKEESHIPPQNLTSHLSPPTSSKVTDDVWRKILETTRPINASIEALLRAATPVSYDGKILTLGVFYRFHKERLEDTPHRRILEDVVSSVLGREARILCVLTEPPVKKVAAEVQKEEPVLTEGEDKDIIKAAEEIFGN